MRSPHDVDGNEKEEPGSGFRTNGYAGGGGNRRRHAGRTWDIRHAKNIAEEGAGRKRLVLRPGVFRTVSGEGRYGRVCIPPDVLVDR